MSGKGDNIWLKWFNLVVYVILFLPLILKLAVFSEKPLEGAYYNPAEPEFSIKNWFTGEFQTQTEAYAGSHFGLHHTMVRLKNEVDFLLFKKPHGRFVVIGKDNYLYESEYIHSFFGRDFVGDKKVEDLMQKIKCVQDSMSKNGRLLIPIIAAGKASFYPEYIPERFKGEKGKTNYEAFVSGFGNWNIDHIDFSRHFIDQKKESRYPLYPKFGIHWSNYGSILVFDSLLKYISSKLPQRLPQLVIDSVAVSDSLRSPDDDVLRTLNLFRPLKSEPMAYPHYRLAGEMKAGKPDMLVVADSFWWYIYSTGLAENMFTNRFWFYNEEMYPETFKEPTYVREGNYFKAIRDAEVIVILHTESTLYKFGNGFVEMLYETYCKRDLQKEEIQSLKGIIRSDSAWLHQVRTKAGKRGISLDSMLTIDAVYTIESKKKPRRK